MRVGIDIGGTTIKIGFVENFKVMDYYEIPTKKESLFKDICLSLKSYLKEHKNICIEKIGFGIPGNVKENYIVQTPNIGIQNVNIKDEIKAFFPNIAIASNNDANVAALGEAIFDGYAQNSYMITLGTGVGGGLILNGKIVDGSHNACGEIGHMFIDSIHNYPCTCGLTGCLETVASATGVVRLAKQYHSKFQTALSLNNLTCKDVFDKAKEDDPLGLYIVDIVSKYLARGLANLAVAVDIDVFYIGGGVAACGNILLDKIKFYYKEYSHYAVKNTEIKLAKLGNLAGMLGAAYL